MADIFDEVTEDLRAERAWRLLRRYGLLLLGLAVAAVIATIGWEIWRSRQAQRAEAASLTYAEAMRLAATPADGDGAHARAVGLFDQVAATAPTGYRTLARLREAALKARSGDADGARRLWDAVAADRSADPLLRDLASLLWARQGIDDGDPEAVAARLRPLAVPGNAWNALARETVALLALRQGQTDQARDGLRELSLDESAPDGVRERAGTLLSGIGG